MAFINKHDTNGSKSVLDKGEFGYDDYTTGGDVGRVYIGTGSTNVPLAKKSDVDTHSTRVDNPHAVTKTQVGLGNVINADTTNASNITSGTLAVLRGGTGVTTSTGTGNNVLSISPILTTPNIGSATGSITGNASTASTLQTARTINGVLFNGSANITVVDSTKAPLASPALTGTPTAPTASTGTNTTQLATTAFVNSEISNDAVLKTTDQTIAGIKTFSSSPIVDGRQVSTGQRKNYLINGNFDSWQRGTVFTSVGGSVSPYYFADRFFIITFNTSGRVNVSLSADVPTEDSGGSFYFGNITADFISYFGQRIEDVRKTANKTVTLSFWAKGTTNITLGQMNMQQNFGVGGSTAINIAPIDVIKNATLTTTWQKFTYTFNIPSIASKTIGTSSYLEFTSSITNTTVGVLIAQVKLEDGSVATDGWHPYDGEFGGEIQACQRYYEVFHAGTIGYNTAGSNIGGLFKFGSHKRDQPTLIVISDPAAVSNSNVSLYIGLLAESNKGAYVFRQVISTNPAQWSLTIAALAEL